jgi:hypothetical protein
MVTTQRAETRRASRARNNKKATALKNKPSPPHSQIGMTVKAANRSGCRVKQTAVTRRRQQEVPTSSYGTLSIVRLEIFGHEWA